MLVGLIARICHVIVDFCFTQERDFYTVSLCLSVDEPAPFD